MFTRNCHRPGTPTFRTCHGITAVQGGCADFVEPARARQSGAALALCKVSNAGKKNVTWQAGTSRWRKSTSLLTRLQKIAGSEEYEQLKNSVAPSGQVRFAANVPAAISAQNGYAAGAKRGPFAHDGLCAAVETLQLDGVSMDHLVYLAVRLSRQDEQARHKALGKVAMAIYRNGSYGDCSMGELARLLNALSVNPACTCCRAAALSLVRNLRDNPRFGLSDALSSLQSELDPALPPVMAPASVLQRQLSLRWNTPKIADAETHELITLLKATAAWGLRPEMRDMASALAEIVVLRKGHPFPDHSQLAVILSVLADMEAAAASQQLSTRTVADAAVKVAGALREHGMGPCAHVSDLAVVLCALGVWARASEVEGAVATVAQALLEGDIAGTLDEPLLWSMISALSHWHTEPAVQGAACKLMTIAGQAQAVAEPSMESVAQYLSALAKWSKQDAAVRAAIKLALRIRRLSFEQVREERLLLGALVALAKWHDLRSVKAAASRIAQELLRFATHDRLTIGETARAFNALRRWHTDVNVQRAAEHMAGTYDWVGDAGAIDARYISWIVHALAQWHKQPFATRAARALADKIVREGIWEIPAQRRAQAPLRAHSNDAVAGHAAPAMNSLKTPRVDATLTDALVKQELKPLLVLRNALKTWPDELVMQHAAQRVEQFIIGQKRHWRSGRGAAPDEAPGVRAQEWPGAGVVWQAGRVSIQDRLS